MTPYRPVFATRQALRIATVGHLLMEAGITAEARAAYPEELERVVACEGDCLVIVDGQFLPAQDTLQRLRRLSPGSRIVIWADTLTPEQLLATIECGLDGLLSARLPPEEAAYALRRICNGERVLRFDPERAGARSNPAPQLAPLPSFDAQWMLHGAESQGTKG